MGKTKKGKLRLQDFTKCNPAAFTQKHRQQQRQTKGQTCLPDDVYKTISKRLHVKTPSQVFEAVGCKKGEEHCLLDKAPVDEEQKKTLRKQYLRPRRPATWEKDPDQWLSNYNIAAVMKQYEKAMPWFRFLGVFPIDFSAPDPYKQAGTVKQCLYKEVCALDLKKEYQRGIRGIGMVFNLDPHIEGGSHWVALYINLENIKKPFVGYFDSTADKTPELISRFMRSLKLQIKTCTLACNARTFQYGNTECGMFSIYFLICMIQGIPFQKFCKEAVHDSFMLQLRTILFST